MKKSEILMHDIEYKKLWSIGLVQEDAHKEMQMLLKMAKTEGTGVVSLI